MRPLEVLLSLANLLTFLALVVPRLRAVPWVRFAAPASMLFCVLQVVLEGPRWQMVPAYLLSALVFLGWPLSPREGVTAKVPSLAHWFAAGTGTLVGLVWLSASVVLPLLIPVFRFPHPTGPFGIGTMTYHWVDSARAEVFTADPTDRRELMVQIWYPAPATASGRRAPYVPHPQVLAPLAKLIRLPGFAFGYLKYVSTNAISGADAAEGSFPVLLFSHGRGGFRQHNTANVEELVSHGYVVATIDHPYAASGVLFPDGRLAKFDLRMFDPGHPGHSAFIDSIIPFLAQDAIFTLDRLGNIDRLDPRGILTGRLDLQHAGMFGVSLGGATTAEACLREVRLKACLMMDVFMPANVVESGLTQPAMWISRDTASMRLEGWGQGDIDETQRTMRTVFDRLPGDGYLVLIPGMFHPNFSDFPLFSPVTRWLHLVGPIDGRRGLTIVSAFEVAFFDRELKGQETVLLDRPTERFPEVVFEARSSRVAPRTGGSAAVGPPKVP